MFSVFNFLFCCLFVVCCLLFVFVSLNIKTNHTQQYKMTEPQKKPHYYDLYPTNKTEEEKKEYSTPKISFFMDDETFLYILSFREINNKKAIWYILLNHEKPNEKKIAIDKENTNENILNYIQFILQQKRKQFKDGTFTIGCNFLLDKEPVVCQCVEDIMLNTDKLLKLLPLVEVLYTYDENDKINIEEHEKEKKNK